MIRIKNKTGDLIEYISIDTVDEALRSRVLPG